MSLTQDVTEAMKNAMREKKQLDLTVLRQLIASFKNEAITLGKIDDPLTDEEALAVTKRESKKRKDSIAQFTEAGRPELAENEQAELVVIEQFLPELLSEDAVKETVQAVIAEAGDNPQFGAVMSATMAKIGAQTDGNVVSKIVKEALA